MTSCTNYLGYCHICIGVCTAQWLDTHVYVPAACWAGFMCAGVCCLQDPASGSNVECDFYMYLFVSHIRQAWAVLN